MLTSKEIILKLIFRVPEEKQTMFLPDVIEEEEEDTKPSHHTSTISLANDSPLCEKR